jgi:hypothetical protein
MSEHDNYLKPDAQRINKDIRSKNDASFTLISGVNGGARAEMLPKIDQTENEETWYGKTNCFIALGADRPAGSTSGEGGVGGTGAGTIDIVAGLRGPRPVYDKPVSRDFSVDSSRIYVSQKTDIDLHLGIPSTGLQLGDKTILLEDSGPKPGIGIISDRIRLVGRQNIKIATKHFSNIAYSKEHKYGGIDIIAGIDVSSKEHALQPMVKGNNLLEALEQIVACIELVQKNMSDFMDKQCLINDEMLGHVHQVGTLVSNKPIENNANRYNTSVRQEITPSILKANYDFQKVMLEYLTLTKGKFINSIFNRVN